MALFNFHHLFISLLFLLPRATPDITSDRAALIALRAGVGSRVLFWNLSSPTPCSWPGVVCSPDKSSVVELHLPATGLSGCLPPNTISNLTNLHTLSLRCHSLSGPLPPDIFSSSNSLRNLYLQHNFLTAGLPDSLFHAKSLVRLNLVQNNFSGPISPLFNRLALLGTLYLQHNLFSSSIPDLKLPALIQFDVSNNNLTGRIPHRLSGFPKASFVGLCLISFMIFYLCRIIRARGKGKDAGLVMLWKTKLLDFDLQELLGASAEVLGNGTFGPTYKVKPKPERGHVVAVKNLRLHVKMGDKQFTAKMKEIGRINHQNIVTLWAYYCNRDEKLVVYDFFPMGSLSAVLHGGVSRMALDLKTRAKIVLGAVRGISYIHAQGPSASHGNIKSSNISLTESYEARVSESSLVQLGCSATPNHGYQAPEVTDPKNVSQKADVYRFGIFVLELVTGEELEIDNDGFDLAGRVQSKLKQDWRTCWNRVWSMDFDQYKCDETFNYVKLNAIATI